MSRIAAAFTLTIATVATSVAVATGPEIGPEAAEFAVAWVAANDPVVAETIEDLEVQLQATLARGEYRSHLVGRVIAGDLSFDDAAAEFLRLNQECNVLPTLRSRFPGQSDEELAHWNVIEYVRNRVIPADEKARILARLAREFEVKYGREPGGPY